MTDPTPSSTEQQLLLAVWRLEEEAYGLAIRDELERLAGRAPAVGAVYTTLMRMEEKGWVDSDLGDPTPVRGGKAKRLFRLTPAGRDALVEARRAMNRLWEGLEPRGAGG